MQGLCRRTKDLTDEDILNISDILASPPEGFIRKYLVLSGNEITQNMK